MTFLRQFMIIAAFSSVVLSGCSTLRPNEKPLLAGEYLHRAEMAGAAEFAPEEYQRLQQEFLQLEKLHKKHNTAAINKRLPRFITAADNLFELSLLNISKAEAMEERASPDTTNSVDTVVEKKSEVPTPARSIKPRLSYTVSEGELLWSIAKRPDIYGDPLLWPLLYQANRDQIMDPSKIYTGQTLTIPRNVSEDEREKARNLAKNSNIFSPE